MASKATDCAYSWPMVSSTATTVTDYLASLPPERRKVVSTMSQFIRQHLPKGYRESMSYGMIATRCRSRCIRRPATASRWCTSRWPRRRTPTPLYLTCAYLDAARAARLREACAGMGRRPDMGKSCLRFKAIEDLPLESIGCGDREHDAAGVHPPPRGQPRMIGPS